MTVGGAEDAPPVGAGGVSPRKGNRVRVAWVERQQFDVGRPGEAAVRLDGDAATGPSPVDALLGALGSCISIDVVEILAKRRTPVEAFEVSLVGERFDGTPRRVTRVTLHFRISGAGIERVHAERAVDLAINKYCSVRDSLDPRIPMEWTLTLNGEAGSIMRSERG